jgi:hypothetical protein
MLLTVSGAMALSRTGAIVLPLAGARALSRAGADLDHGAAAAVAAIAMKA